MPPQAFSTPTRSFTTLTAKFLPRSSHFDWSLGHQKIELLALRGNDLTRYMGTLSTHNIQSTQWLGFDETTPWAFDHTLPSARRWGCSNLSLSLNVSFASQVASVLRTTHRQCLGSSEIVPTVADTHSQVCAALYMSSQRSASHEGPDSFFVPPIRIGVRPVLLTSQRAWTGVQRT